jgi:hypothetical protein
MRSSDGYGHSISAARSGSRGLAPKQPVERERKYTEVIRLPVGEDSEAVAIFRVLLKEIKPTVNLVVGLLTASIPSCAGARWAQSTPTDASPAPDFALLCQRDHVSKKLIRIGQSEVAHDICEFMCRIQEASKRAHRGSKSIELFHSQAAFFVSTREIRKLSLKIGCDFRIHRSINPVRTLHIAGIEPYLRRVAK